MLDQPYSVLVIQTLDDGQRVQVSRCRTALEAWAVAVRLSQERPGNYWVVLEAAHPTQERLQLAPTNWGN